MNDSAVSLRRVFSLPENGARDATPNRWNAFQASLSKEVRTIKWPAAMPDVAEKICELFDVKLPDLFLVSWKKSDDLRTLLSESKKTPEATKYWELADHTIRSEHHPFVEARIRNVPVKKIEFTVSLSFKLKGFVLKIKAGEIEEMRTGRCEVEGTVAYAGLTIAEKKLAPIDLPGSIKLTSAPLVHTTTQAVATEAAV